MVALKRDPGDVDVAGLVGSRNAVVALKPFTARDLTGSGTGKQERRGGIETHSPSHAHAVNELGSRNAVVALKLDPQVRAAENMGEEAGTPWWH